MLALINDYLQIGVQAAGNTPSAWTLPVATVMVAAMIIKRRPRD